MNLLKIKISDLKNNIGQIEGLPKNPRIIKDEKYEKLKKSIIDDPEMLELREIIAYDNNGELMKAKGLTLITGLLYVLNAIVKFTAETLVTEVKDPRYCDVIVKRMLTLDNTLKVKRNGFDVTNDFV